MSKRASLNCLEPSLIGNLNTYRMESVIIRMNINIHERVHSPEGLLGLIGLLGPLYIYVTRTYRERKKEKEREFT